MASPDARCSVPAELADCGFAELLEPGNVNLRLEN